MPITYSTLLSENERLRREKDDLQARIDSLMLEHCPDELTEEQIIEYSKHQKQVDHL